MAIRNPIESVKQQSLSLLQTIDRDPLLAAVTGGFAAREEYIRFLSATYQHARWSGPLFAATAAGLERHGKYPWLIPILLQVATEEALRERWVLDDLRACGHNPLLVTTSDPPISVEAFVDWSLTLAEDGSPAYLGAGYVLEFLSVQRARGAAANLRARAPIPHIDQAVSYLAGPRDSDIGRLSLLDEVLQRIGPEDGQAAALSAAVLRTLYPRFFCASARTRGTSLARSA